MVALTRFNCMVGSTAIMRRAVTEVLHHVEHRRVGGVRLIEAPLMRNVVADLVLETEAALWLSMRVARALDRGDDANEQLFVRLATALGKYWICKRAPQHVNEAQECLGGLGYVEEHVLPRLYREAPVNSIWEGSGNVQCIDLLRALSRSPETIDVLVDELAGAMGARSRRSMPLRRGSPRICAAVSPIRSKHACSRNEWRCCCKRACSSVTRTRRSPLHSSMRDSARAASRTAR